jgi:hypothetical protein
MIYIVIYVILVFCLLVFLMDRMGKRMETLLLAIDDKLKKVAEVMEQINKNEMKRCPFSAETILKEAVQCTQHKNIAEPESPVIPPARRRGRGFFEVTEASESEAVQLLLSKCTDINAIDSIGFTQLHSAVYKGNKEAAEQLISKGANANQKDGFGRTPLHWAAYKGQAEMARLLIPKVDDINAKHNAGFTPLHVAASYGNTEVVNILIDAGADVNAKDNDGKTPLNLAIEHDHHDIAKMLKDHGA